MELTVGVCEWGDRPVQAWPEQTETTVRVSIEVDFSRVERYEVFHVFDPFRIVIDIFPKDAPPGPVLTTPPLKEQTPKPAQPARGPPAWDDPPVAAVPDWDALAQPQPEYVFDQQVQW